MWCPTWPRRWTGCAPDIRSASAGRRGSGTRSPSGVGRAIASVMSGSGSARPQGRFDEAGHQRRPIAWASQHGVAVAEHVEAAYPVADRTGPHRKPVGQPRVGDPIMIAVCDQHRLPGQLVHRLVLAGPRCERAHRHHCRVVGDPQRRSGTHRVTEQGHRDLRVVLTKMVKRPPRVRQRMHLGFVPAPVSIPQQPNRKTPPTAAPVQCRSERDHPQVGTPPTTRRFNAGGLASVQDQDDRPHRVGAHRPEVLDCGRDGCHHDSPVDGGRRFSSIAEYAARMRSH